MFSLACHTVSAVRDTHAMNVSYCSIDAGMILDVGHAHCTQCSNTGPFLSERNQGLIYDPYFPRQPLQNI